jgi:hypothetical protein
MEKDGRTNGLKDEHTCGQIDTVSYLYVEAQCRSFQRHQDVTVLVRPGQVS